MPPLEPIGLVALTERMRDQASETIAFLHRAGVAVKVISGDGPVTVEAVARAAGIDTTGRVITGGELPREGASSAPPPSGTPSSRGSSPTRSARSSRRSCAAGAASRWSATASTTCPR